MAKIYEFTDPKNDFKAVASVRSKRTLNKIALHSDYMMRMAVACNPFCSDKSRERLSKDLYPQVRLAVAKSVFTKDPLLLKLTKDKDEEVVFWAKRTLMEKKEDEAPQPA